MTGFSVEKDGSMSGGLEDWATSAGKAFGKAKKLFSVVTTGFEDFQNLDEAIRGSGTSFNDYIKYLSRSEDATEAFGLATLYTRARVLLLNMALSTGLALAASLIVKKISEAAQSIETNATKSKEAADAAQSTTSSLKDLVSAYEELGDKSGWDTEDFDQAKDIQAEILDLAKEQGTLDEDKLGGIDLQNGKYQEQLAILKDITSEQLKASQKELVQSKDAQGTKLVQTAKKNNRSHWIGTFWSNAEMQMGDQIKDAGIDIFNWAGGYGADNINDADSIVDYYNNLGKAIEYIIDNTTDEERAVNGKYHALYQFLMDERNALKDDVDSYTGSISALKQNQFKSDFAEWSSNEAKKPTQATSEIDAKIKATKEYQDAVKEAQKTEEEWNSQGYGKYGNIDNFHRDKIDWTEENLAKYKDFVDEQNSIFPGTIEKGSYSTVLGSWDTISDEDGTEHPFAFTPMLQTDSGLVPLTEDQLWNYIDTIVEQCYDENGKLDIDKLMELDATGLDEDINGVMMRVKGMIAGVADGKNQNGGVYSAADILALSGDSNEDIKNDLIDLYGPDADLTPVDDNGNLSRYVGKSMHDAQAVAQEGKDNIETVYNQLYNDLENGSSGESDGNSSAPVRYVDHIKSAFETLADSLGKNSGEMTVSDVVGLSQAGVQLTDEQAQALDTLTAAANKYDTTIQGVAEAGEENGLFGGIESSQNGIAAAAQQMDTISKKIDEIQSAYKACTTAMDEYNKYGYMSTDALQGLLSMSDEYLACLDVVDGKLQINNDRYADLIAAQYTEAEVTAIEQAVNELTEAFKKATLDELDKRIKAANKTGGAAATALANSLSSDKANIESGKISVSDYLVGLGTDLERVNTELDKYQANWNTLKDAMDEWNTTGQLTQDTMQKLQELPKEFSSLLTYDEDGNAKIDVKALRQSYVDKLSAFAKEFEGSPIGIQVQAMIDDVREPTHEEYVKLAEKTATYQKVLAQYTKKMSAIDSNKDLSEDEVLQQKAEVQKELDDALEKALLEVQETDAQVTTKLKKHWDGVEKVVEEFKSALSDAKDILSSFLSLLSSANDKSNNDLKIWGDVMNKVIDKRIEALNKQKEALEENNEATERAIELSKAQDALARAQQQRTTRVYTENGYEWQANAEDVRTAREDLADKQREWNNKDAEKAIDDQIKKYNEFKDKLSEVMDDIGKGWKDYQKELEYTAQIQKMSLSQMEGSLDSYHNKIIASLNTGSAITGVQNLIANLESLINTLTKLNNLYSMLKTGEYKDLGIKGLWDTIKGFFGKGKSENVNKSFKDTFDAAKKAFNAGKKQLTDTATTGANDVINAMINQIKTSGNGLVETFGGIWEKIKLGAQSLFSGSGEGGGIVSTVVNGFKAIGNAVSKSKIGSTILGGLGNVGTALVSGGGKLVAGAGKLITTAGSALAAAGPAAIPIAGAAALGIYGGTKAMKNQKKIWSNKEDGFGKKAVKSVASFFWDISPIGAIVNLCKDISGKSKKTAENTKDTADNTSETADNTKKQQSVTNLTINATQVVSKEENKVTDATDKKNDVTSNESQTTDNTNNKDKTVKTTATTLTGAGLGAAAGMAIGGPVGALIGTLLGGFAGFFLGRHANGLKSSKTNHFANVDERGSELIVRKPASGRYTYLETGDGVVPADITSRLFEMGGNPDKWFSDQLAKHSSASMVQSRDAGGISLSIGDVNVNNPVGDSDALARELVNRLPNKVVQELNRR